MAKPTTAILSHDQPFIDALCERLQPRCEIAGCQSMQQADETIATAQAAYFIADFRRIDGGGHSEAYFLEQIRHKNAELPIIVLTAEDCAEPLERAATCSGALRMTADDPTEAVAEWLEAELAKVEAALAATETKKKTTSRKGESESVLAGITRRFETNTPQLRRMLSDLEIAAQHDVTILLVGETGSGKTFLSQLIHEVSPRSADPFLPVACGALPSDLIESELFGHVKGAFTSAHADKEGKFIAAGRGTILLDEIDVLGAEQQVKLLRVIETGQFEPVGSNQTMRSQARLVVASNLELQPLVEQGKFRPDLYYRLNMLKFDIPPLRQRRPDIEPLTRKFISQLSAKHHVEISSIDEDLFETLENYPWPGNVRELENVIQRAVIYCRDGVLTPGHLPPHVVMGQAGPTNDPSVSLNMAVNERSNLGNQIAVTERDIIEEALFKNNHSRTKTAKELGISRVTLYNKMKKYGMSK